MKTQVSPRQLVMLKEFLAELVGTCVLLMCGCGCVAQAVLSGGAHGGMLSINIGWGLGVLLGVLVAGPISGKIMQINICFQLILLPSSAQAPAQSQLG